MNAITKFFAGLWITIASTSISAFNQGIIRPNIIQKLVYNNYCSYLRENTPEKQVTFQSRSVIFFGLTLYISKHKQPQIQEENDINKSIAASGEQWAAYFYR